MYVSIMYKEKETRVRQMVGDESRFSKHVRNGEKHFVRNIPTHVRKGLRVARPGAD